MKELLGNMYTYATNKTMLSNSEAAASYSGPQPWWPRLGPPAFTQWLGQTTTCNRLPNIHALSCLIPTVRNPFTVPTHNSTAATVEWALQVPCGSCGPYTYAFTNTTTTQSLIHIHAGRGSRGTKCACCCSLRVTYHTCSRPKETGAGLPNRVRTILLLYTSMQPLIAPLIKPVSSAKALPADSNSPDWHGLARHPHPSNSHNDNNPPLSPSQHQPTATATAKPPSVTC